MAQKKPGNTADFPALDYGILHNLVGHLLRHAFNRGHLIFAEVFEDRGVTSLQFMIMELVQKNPGVSHAEIARAMSTAPSVISTTLRPLITSGHLIARPAKTDARSKGYYLSETGENWFNEMRGSIFTSEDRLTAGLTIEERNALLSGLRKIAGIPDGPTPKRPVDQDRSR